MNEGAFTMQLLIIRRKLPLLIFSIDQMGLIATPKQFNPIAIEDVLHKNAGVFMHWKWFRVEKTTNVNL